MLIAQIIPGMGPPEMVLVAVIGILLFGKRLPEVGRSIGRGIVEFKKGLRGIDEELDIPGTRFEKPRAVSTYHNPSPSFKDSYYDVDVPKFEPPTAPPTPATGSPDA